MILAKPEPYKVAKARRKRQHLRERKKVRGIVFALQGGRCERCKRRVSDDVPEWAAERAHVNEKVPRSRGGSATDITNLELLCSGCHIYQGQHAPTAERLAILRGEQKGKS